MVTLQGESQADHQEKESYIKITLFFYIRIKLVKPRMDFRVSFPKYS